MKTTFFTFNFLFSVIICTAQNYVIAFTVKLNDTQDYEVFTMNPDGSNKRNITNNRDVAWTYYAFRNRLFFVSDRDTCHRCFFLFETNSNGTRPKKLSTLQLEDSQMSSRKNGEEMVATGRIGSIRHQLFLINTKTGSFTQLTNDTSARFGDPCFSPDGRRIVFSYKKNKRDRNTHEELFITEDDCKNMKQLTFYPEENKSAKDFGYKAASARWHPTENFISYVSKQDGRHSIFAVNPNSRVQWKLTKNNFAEGWHDWSPDGQWLIFNTSDVDESRFDISLMNWKTKEEKQLTDTTHRYNQAPVFLER